ncbi:TIGR04219 family outer membrane beta-barrel protein [Neiella sp. HB171785]|uniref:TIGR04219 family outer membrane beta-barrel protein n=1 Tax=Neiella litorisoli TaxID=2771431 RepID=A0A8J6QJB1_9GAMM|nr:TIGR04219 family outer membrane beta-barrel protein [Neiella litorisoli]MBD1390053.1 TIGR04219 family outer membrane beta-barrel protein [Neiella litorisoli]
MKNRLLAAAVLAALPALAQADTFAGIYAGVQYWDMDAEGEFGTGNTTQQYGLNDEGKASIWLAVEHPVPLLPNLKLRYNQMDTDGFADVEDFEFGDIIYNGESTIDAELDHTDIIMYYEIFDNPLTNLDIGLNLKYGDYKVSVVGEVEVGDSTIKESSEESYKGVIPMLYGATELVIPGTGFSIYGEANWIGYDDYNAYDVQIGTQYLLVDNLAVEAAIQLGYRKVKLDLDDVDDLTIDAEFDGVYAGLQVHF